MSPQSWLDMSGNTSDDALLQSEADMLERAIIASLRDGGGLSPYNNDAETESANSNTDRAAEASDSSAATRSPGTKQTKVMMTPQSLLEAGKTLEEVDEMLLQQVRTG